MRYYGDRRNFLDRLAESFQQHLTLEGIFTMVVNIAIILAIIHYLVIPLWREVRKDTAPAVATTETSAMIYGNGKQAVIQDFGSK